ncbi:hypothetical protein EBT16_03965, partial [bacterium]|nr:hypothetical protein [bacterium]
PSGTFIAIGSASVNAALASEINPETNFDGKVSQIKFWSRHVKQDEWFEHVKNYKSIGTDDPLVTNQFEVVQTGSFEKIRLDCAIKQSTTQSERALTLPVRLSNRLLRYYDTGLCWGDDYKAKGTRLLQDH